MLGMRILIAPRNIRKGKERKGRICVCAQRTLCSWQKRLTAMAQIVLMAMSSGAGALAADKPATNAGFENGPYLLVPKPDSMVLAFEGKTGDAAKVYYDTAADTMLEMDVNAQDGPVFEGEKMHLNCLANRVLFVRSETFCSWYH